MGKTNKTIWLPWSHSYQETQYKNNKISHKHRHKTCMFVSTIVFSLGALYCKMV